MLVIKHHNNFIQPNTCIRHTKLIIFYPVQGKKYALGIFNHLYFQLYIVFIKLNLSHKDVHVGCRDKIFDDISMLYSIRVSDWLNLSFKCCE